MSSQLYLYLAQFVAFLFSKHKNLAIDDDSSCHETKMLFHSKAIETLVYYFSALCGPD